MSTTQRSESMNAFFDGYVNSKTTLKQFVEQYENALRSKAEKECQADYESFCKQVGCVTFYDMEKQIQAIYTTTKFKEFQSEITGMMYCRIISVDQYDMVSVFTVAEDIVYGERGRKRVAYRVLYYAGQCDVKCTCYKFEFRGIQCRHAISVLIHNNISLLPEKYIIKRWRKDVRRVHTRIKISYDGWITTPEQLRYETMISAFTKVADLATDDEDQYKNVMTWIEGANRNMSLQVSPHFVTKNVPFTNDPIIKRGKGRPPCTRKKPTMRRRGKRTANQDVNNLMDVNTQSSQRQTIVILTEVRGTQESHVGYSNQGRDGGFLSLLRNASEVGETSGSGGYQSLVDGIDEDM
ncbi:protein FAR-RED ELONGATED HYPOCOTYL 3-like [Tripterygium wilfordii]|uniref:protein FAR-RED ELONGATED HYPOCOTYL 3-like n=1 Tax=Tripterygium wilfordii TaxID=458696 RepID=UPI0018F8581C|nr:protein FAR-RED ELONGATED HYPOCOTYL 3-like [Tripterygium wilfordii]